MTEKEIIEFLEKYQLDAGEVEKVTINAISESDKATITGTGENEIQENETLFTYVPKELIEIKELPIVNQIEKKETINQEQVYRTNVSFTNFFR